MMSIIHVVCYFFFFQAEDGIRDLTVTGVQTCALPIWRHRGLAVLLLELAHDVSEIDELRLVEPGKVHPHLDDVVTGLRLDFGGILRRLLGGGDVIDTDLDARVLREALADLGQLLVGGGGEVVPAQVRDLALLTAGGRDAGGENTGQACTGRREELSTVRRIHTPSCQGGAAGAEDDEGRGATDYRPRAPLSRNAAAFQGSWRRPYRARALSDRIARPAAAAARSSRPSRSTSQPSASPSVARAHSAASANSSGRPLTSDPYMSLLSGARERISSSGNSAPGPRKGRASERSRWTCGHTAVMNAASRGDG